MYKEELKSAKELALEAGKLMREYFSIDKQVEYKEDDTPVTYVDKTINKMVIDKLSKQFDYEVIGEEESTVDYGEADIFWLCDPVDGTRAFINGVPTVMFSLALIKDGEPVLGVAYDPFVGRLFYGIKGVGSYCNETRLSVSDFPLNGHKVLVSSEVDQILDSQESLKKLTNAGAKLIAIEGAVYKSCLVAEGKFVGYISDLPKNHDMAAVQVILEEAGGLVTAPDGSKLDYSKPFIGAIATNKAAHKELVSLIA